MLGEGRKKQRLILVVVLLLITPFLAIAVQSLLIEDVKMTHRSETRFAPAQYVETGQITIQDEADFESYGFPGTGEESSPYLINGLNITSMGETCVFVANVNASFVISNCLFQCARPAYPVIWLLNVQNSTVKENIIVGGSDGVLGSQIRNMQVLGNTICSASSGLSFVDSYNITVEENSIYGNARGVMLIHSSLSMFSDNRVYSNTLRGFNVDEISTFNSFTNNLIGWNEISAAYSRNAEDDGSNNTWFANLWSDCTPPDSYNVSGEGNSTDFLPIRLIDTQGPLINHHPDVIMAEGSQENVTWYPRDAYPNLYTLRMNAVIIRTGPWFADEFSFNLQYLEPGDYTFIISVTDGSGNTTDDLVEVSVLYVPLRDIATELVAYASGLSVALFVVILALIRRRR